MEQMFRRTQKSGCMVKLTTAKFELGVVGALAACLLLYSVVRAQTLSFNSDESGSFMSQTPLSYSDIITCQTFSSGTNHPLNSVLMKACKTAFGNSELALRIPNLVAHVIFMLFSIAWLHAFMGKGLLIPGFILLNANPYTIEFVRSQENTDWPWHLPWGHFTSFICT